MQKTKELQDEQVFTINEIPTTQIYLNPHNQIVIHQKDSSLELENQFIFFPIEYSRKIIKEIKKLTKLIEREEDDK